MSSLDYSLDKLSEAKARFAENHQKCEETALLTTPEGIKAYQLARALCESDRRQVLYWTSEAEKAFNGRLVA